MNNRIRTGLLCSAMVLVSCGGAASEPGATSSTEEAETTSATAAPTTTSTSSTTTTVATTTTVGTDDNSQLRALMSSVQGVDTIASGRIEGSIEMTGLDQEASGLSEIVILFSTAFDTNTGDSSFLIDMSSMAGAADLTDPDDPFAGMAAGLLGEIEFRQIGDRVFLKFPFFTAMFGADTDWISMPAEDGGEFTNSFDTLPTDPQQVIEAYDDASATIDDLGVENVNGVDATHYRISLDAEQMEMSAQERAELEASGLFANGIIPMDIWISEEGYLVRMVLEIDGTGVDAPPEDQFESMTMRYDFFDINGDISIEPPPASDVTDVESLEGFFGSDFGS